MFYRTGTLYIFLFLVACDLISATVKRHKIKKDTRVGADDDFNENEDSSVQLKSNENLDNNDKLEVNVESTQAKQSSDNSEDVSQNNNDTKRSSESNQELEDVSQNNDQYTSQKNDSDEGNSKDDTSKKETTNESENEKFTESKEKNTPAIDNHEAQARPFTVGDTFTPQEMLPITQKLLSKVKNPGEGKGFVSSSKNPQQLADKLFEAFFMTFKRIVTLSENDIEGLDALQALALSGEAADNTTEDITEAGEMVFLRGQMVKMSNYPKKTKYKLIMKTLKPGDNNLRRGKQGAIKLANKLRKKRRLVVNKRRVGQEKPKPPCYWRYDCTSSTELDTCRIYTQCINDTKDTKAEYIEVPHRSDEHSKAVQQFRKMLGISLIDEEVEKILENRIIRLKPQPLNDDNRIERVESLSEYFNNIAMVQAHMSTSAMLVTPTEESNNNDTNEEPSPADAQTEPERKFLKLWKTTKPYSL